MARRRHRRSSPSLEARYPPSEPCACAVCLAYCARPGWWTVAQAREAIAAGYGARMMLEVAPERTFGVLSPALRGCERFYAVQERAGNGCTFLQHGRCELHNTPYLPLECRFCHHTRAGLGGQCHADLERDWSTPAGQALVAEWIRWAGLWKGAWGSRL